IVDEMRDLIATFSRVPFRTKVPAENATGTAGWVGEGLPVPNYKSTLATRAIDYAKVVAMTIVSRELARHGLAAEQTMLRILRRFASRHLANALFDPTLSGTSSRPASLTYGCNTTISTGSTDAQIRTDTEGMPAKLQTVCSAGRWAMRPLTFARVVAAWASVG